MNFSFEMNNARKDVVQIKDTAKFSKFVEICSALFAGADTTKYGKETDGVVAKLKDLGTRADMGDWRARSEINETLKFMVQPKLIEAMQIFSMMGNYHEIGYNEQPIIKTWNYEGIDARMQAAHGDVNFSGQNWIEYAITTKTISAGMAVDYREFASGNFGGNVAEQTSQVQIDMNNKAVAYAMTVLHTALAGNTDYVKFYDEYDTTPTQAEVDAMVEKVRRLGGRVSIMSEYANLATISSWNGYKTISTSYVPFSTATQVEEMYRTGLNGFYNGSALVELPNRYNFTKPLANKTGFETYYDADKIYILAQGQASPFHIFRKGGITTMSGNDVETGIIKTRFDVEIGADVTKGREFEIALLAKAD